MLLDHIISSDAGRLLNNSICGTEISFVKTEVMRLDPYILIRMFKNYCWIYLRFRPQDFPSIAFNQKGVTDDEKPINFQLNIHSVTFVPLDARGCQPWHGCKVRELRARKRINKLINLPTRFCWRRDPKSKINVSCCAALMS